MKTKGYISVFALVISVLLFTLITVILIGVDSENSINRNQKDYYQNCLISESIFNKLQYDEDTKDTLEKNFKELNVNTNGEKYFFLDYDEILKGGKVKIKVFTKKDGKYHIYFKVEYKKTFTKSNITYTKNDSFLLNKEEIVKIEGENEVYEKILNNEFERIEGDIVAFTYEDKNYFISNEEYNKIVEEFNILEDENKVFLEMLKEKSKILEKNKLYFVNTNSINIEEVQNFNISGIFINNGNVVGEGKIVLNGVLINRDKNSKSFEINGKVIEEDRFLGKVKLDSKILKEINDSLKIEEKYELENYYIR